ncbi:galactosyltransferase family protein [Tasmannia lanceolata]|uniref:galactosyltransferase family protein n=1 Tax=Tasmannia lanceolata TaxID=3420 RepID=UPI004062F39E
MKMKQFESSYSFIKIVFTLSSFLIVTVLGIFVCLSEIQLQSLMTLGRSTFFSSFSYQNFKSTSRSLDEKSSSPQPDFRLLIGILTLPDQYPRRNLLRQVYGIQTPTKAQIDVKFVFCNLTKDDHLVLVALEIMRYNDIIILNCTENMNSGKTYTYFSSLPDILDSSDGEAYPYDYVMKADDDIYFRLDKLVESLRPMPREDMYYGFVIPCDEMNPYGHYMAGMGYIVSWDLVEWIRTSDFARNHTKGTEDKLLGEWFAAGHRAKNRYNTKPAMYDYPVNVEGDKCSHELTPDTIAIHRLKNQDKWIKTLRYFNVTSQLKPSKLYHIP